MIPILNKLDMVAPGIVRLRSVMVNVFFLQAGNGWVLIDAGLRGSSAPILETATAHFDGLPPLAILMTHGHFDHAGGLPSLLKKWDVPVYTHRLELPHLAEAQKYPPPDPSVGKGTLAMLSFLYPNEGIGLGDRVLPMPEDGAVPHLGEWRWIHTPGHTVGHISFFRDHDRLLIAGDAFVTTQQESIYSVVTQEQEVHGPPAYFTPDWRAAKQSVETLAALDPAIAATGHGTPMAGDPLRRGLRKLCDRFDEIAVPTHGRYVSDHQS